ncbi:host cell division inhibitor Icd-like protein [Pluralibacter gergoviae]
MYVRNPLAWILLCTYVNTANIEKTTPRTVGAVPGRLTKPLYEVTTMAGSQHTQTHPKFTWRFLALNRHDKKARPCRLSVEAATERDARRILAPHFILSLAARLPVREVGHV